VTGADDRTMIIELLDALAGALDARDWHALREMFTADAVAYRDGNTGLDAITRGIRAKLGGCGPSQHLLGNYQVRIAGDRASSVTKVRVMHQGVGERSHASYECLGDYHDEFIRTGCGWRISRRRFAVAMTFGDPDVLQPDRTHTVQKGVT
jgi:hypothetical protein